MELGKYTETELELYNIIDNEPNCKARNAIRNSKKHLEKAATLVDIDKGMATFRIITAIEEASTGIILAFQDKKYQNSDRLNHKNHIHKAAISCFFDVLQLSFDDFADDELPKMYFRILNTNGRNLLKIVIATTIDGRSINLIPDPPLDLTISSGDNIKPISFTSKFGEITQRNKLATFKSYLYKCANRRNLILYASENGCPDVIDISDDYIANAMTACWNMALAYLLISQTNQHQKFVQQSIDSILLNVIGLENIDLNSEV